MSIYLPTDESKISNAFLAVVGAYPGYTYMNAAKSYGLVPTIQALIDYSGLTTASALAARVASNLGLTGTALTDGTAYLSTVTFAGASSGWASNLASTLNLFATLTNNAVYGTAASAHVSRINSAVTYSAVSSNTSTNVTTLAAAAGSPGTTAESTGSTFTLTADVNGITGTAANDTINGLVGVSGTFNVGDVIDGGAGTDTLNLNVQSGGQSQLVTISNVENINARLLEAGPGSALALNAIDWSGVTTLSFNNSLDETAIRVSGMTASTTISVRNEVDVNIAVRGLTSGADSVSLTLTSAGSGGGTAASLASAGAADIDFDLENAGLIDTLRINLAAGPSYATLEAGDDLRAITISGAGAAYLSTDDRITSLDMSQASGNIDITLSGASDVTAVGGAGNDTLRLGTTISNGDSFNGGAGTDTIAATIGSFNRNLNTTAVEIATITFTDDSGGQVLASGNTIATYNLRASSAGADGGVIDVATATTINITASGDAFDAVTLDGVSGAQTMTILAGTASGNTTISGLYVTDVASVSIANDVGTANNAGTLTFTTATFDSDVKSLTIQTATGTGAIAFSDALAVGGATSLTIISNASGGIDIGSSISGNALNTVLLQANGSADLTFDSLEGTGLRTVTIDANGGANIYGATAASGLEFGNGATGSTIIDVVVNLAAETNSDIGTAAAAASGLAINTTGALSLTVNVNVGSGSGGVHLGTATMAAGSASADLTGTVYAFSAGSIGANSIVRSELLNIDGFTGTQVNIGAISLGASAGLFLFEGGVDATDVDNVDVSAQALTMGVSAQMTMGAITTTGGMVNGISVSGTDGADAVYGNIRASGVGAISVNVGSGGGFTVGTMQVSASGAIGSIEIGGADAGTATFGAMSASAVGAVSISGAVDVTFGAIVANRIGTVNATAMTKSGSLTIDLSGVSAAAEVNLGVADSNTVISGLGNDVITLVGGRTGFTGNDVIRFTTATQGTDNIVNFIAGAANSGGDRIEFGASIGGGGGAGVRGGNGASATATSTVDLTVAISGATTIAATDNVIVITTALNSTSVVGFVASGITFTSAIASSGNLALAWTDGTDTYISLLNFSASGSTTLASSSASLQLTTLAQLSGVTPGALVAANFDFL